MTERFGAARVPARPRRGLAGLRVARGPRLHAAGDNAGTRVAAGATAHGCNVAKHRAQRIALSAITSDDDETAMTSDDTITVWPRPTRQVRLLGSSTGSVPSAVARVPFFA
jgi:hypothetical protein